LYSETESHTTENPLRTADATAAFRTSTLQTT
jgi:hypothetical protein